MTAPFPHTYRATTSHVAPHLAALEAPPRPAIDGGPPSEFGGSPYQWSPEHLLASAIGLCLLTTFEALAERERLAIASWQSVTTAILDKTPAGLAFTSFAIDVELSVDAEEVARASALLERAHRNCIIGNALRTAVALRPVIKAAAPGETSPRPAPHSPEALHVRRL